MANIHDVIKIVQSDLKGANKLLGEGNYILLGVGKIEVLNLGTINFKKLQ